MFWNPTILLKSWVFLIFTPWNGVYLPCSVVLVSAVHQSDSALPIHVSPLFWTPSHLVTTEHWAEFPVLYSRFSLVICVICNSVYVSVPIFLSVLSPWNHDYVHIRLWKPLLGPLKPGNGPEILLGQGPTQQPPQQHRVLQQLQQGDWRLQQLHLQQRHPHQQQQLLQDAYMQQVIVLLEIQKCLYLIYSFYSCEIHANCK